MRYGLLGISFDSKKAEIRSIIDNLPDTSYLYNIPKSGWTKKVSVTKTVAENWDSKTPSVGSILAYLETTA